MVFADIGKTVGDWGAGIEKQEYICVLFPLLPNPLTEGSLVLVQTHLWV